MSPDTITDRIAEWYRQLPAWFALLLAVLFFAWCLSWIFLPWYVVGAIRSVTRAIERSRIK